MTDLIVRIAGGMTTVDDAATVSRMQERLAAYEQALRKIAVHGHGDDAMLACRVLTAVSSGEARPTDGDAACD